jgi:hypothetical protein
MYFCQDKKFGTDGIKLTQTIEPCIWPRCGAALVKIEPCIWPKCGVSSN